MTWKWFLSSDFKYSFYETAIGIVSIVDTDDQELQHKTDDQELQHKTDD